MHRVSRDGAVTAVTHMPQRLTLHWLNLSPC